MLKNFMKMKNKLIINMKIYLKNNFGWINYK